MSNPCVSSLIRSSGLSKAGVIKRGCFCDVVVVSRKAIVVSILVTEAGIEMVKCSRC